MLIQPGVLENLICHVPRHDLERNGERLSGTVTPDVVITFPMANERASVFAQYVANRLAIALHAVARTLVRISMANSLPTWSGWFSTIKSETMPGSLSRKASIVGASALRPYRSLISTYQTWASSSQAMRTTINPFNIFRLSGLTQYMRLRSYYARGRTYNSRSQDQGSQTGYRDRCTEPRRSQAHAWNHGRD